MIRFHISIFAVAVLAAHAFSATSHGNEQYGDPPPELRTLVKTGNVGIEFYDPAFERRRYPGHTAFMIEVKLRFLYDYRVVTRAGRQFVQIRPRIERSDWKLTNTVTLPESYDTPEMWDSALMLHELDHVAITSDPRVRMLIERLHQAVTVIEQPIQQPGDLNDAAIQKLINDEYVRRRDAVIELVKKNNQLMDKVSVHGNRRIPDREAFFRKLYSKEMLDEQQFPYLADVVGLLKTAKYERAKLLYHLADQGQP